MTYLAAIPLCPLYAAPDEADQRVDEILTGWQVTGPEAQNGDWWQVRTHYGYTGWVRRSWLVPDRGWTALQRRVATGCSVDVLVRPQVEAPVAATLLRGGLAAVLPEGDPPGWHKVLLPDGQQGYAKSGLLGPYPEGPADLPEDVLRAQVVERARSYLGVQYRWGGKSPMGIDCSGLAFMAWFFSGVLLYRDAKIVDGYPVRPIPAEQCKPADLLYFPGHVALCLGEGRYIHAAAKVGSDGVVINSLDPAHPDYRADLAEQLYTGGTVFPLNK